EQESCTFTSTGCKNNRAAFHLVFLHIIFVNIGNTGGQAFVVGEHFTHHGIVEQINLAGCNGWLYQNRRRREIGIGSGTSPVALAAVKTSAALVIYFLCENRQT